VGIKLPPKIGTLVATLAQTISGIFLCDGAFRIPPKKCQTLPPTNPNNEEKLFHVLEKRQEVVLKHTKHKSISSIIDDAVGTWLSVYTSA
jgi:hypothetical protein